MKNVDLWQRLDEALTHHQVHWHWVKGHAGHAMNERADELARDGLVAARAGAVGAMKHPIVIPGRARSGEPGIQSYNLCGLLPWIPGPRLRRVPE